MEQLGWFAYGSLVGGAVVYLANWPRIRFSLDFEVGGGSGTSPTNERPTNEPTTSCEADATVGDNESARPAAPVVVEEDDPAPTTQSLQEMYEEEESRRAAPTSAAAVDPATTVTGHDEGRPVTYPQGGGYLTNQQLQSIGDRDRAAVAKRRRVEAAKTRFAAVKGQAVAVLTSSLGSAGVRVSTGEVDETATKTLFVKAVDGVVTKIVDYVE